MVANMRVVVGGDDEGGRAWCRQAARGLGLDCAADDAVPLAGLRLRLARRPAADLVLVLMAPEPGAAQAAVAGVSEPVVAVVPDDWAGPPPEGATSVWPASRVRDGLRQTAAAHRGRTGRGQGVLVAVTAALPGSGATTVAAGLAFAAGGPAVLAELAAPVPELALILDLAPPHPLADLVAAGDRLDPAMIRQAVVRHAAGVDLLADPHDAAAPAALTADAVRDFQVLLRAIYPWAVVDAGHARAAGNPDLCRHADAVVVVTRLDPPALRLTRRHVDDLLAAGLPEAALRLVANRYDQPGLTPWRAAEEALGRPVVAWLPDDPRSVNRSVAAGQPLALSAPRCKLARELAKLAAGLRAGG